jgi:hypothetical protein
MWRRDAGNYVDAVPPGGGGLSWNDLSIILINDSIKILPSAH